MESDKKWEGTMSRQKKERLRHPKPKAKMGRPPRVMPPKTDRTAGEIAQAMLSLPADHQFTYTAKTVYRCVGCQWVVEYPDTLYRDGRCRKCRGGARVALEGFG